MAQGNWSDMEGNNQYNHAPPHISANNKQTSKQISKQTNKSISKTHHTRSTGLIWKVTTKTHVTPHISARANKKDTMKQTNS